MLIRNQTAPCLLQEINNFDPRRDPAALFDRDRPSNNVCSHVYATNLDRSRLPSSPDERPQGNVSWGVAATCTSCRSHVDLLLDFDGSTQPCPSPFHHFLYEGTGGSETGVEGSEGIYQWRCTSCQALLIVHLQRPVLSIPEAFHFCNPFSVQTRMRQTKALFPNNFIERSPIEVLRTFRKCVLDVLQNENNRDIPAGNQTFMSVFGEGATKLLQRLGFTYLDDGSGPSGKGKWQLPKPPPHPFDPAPDPERSLLEDVRDEIIILMSQRPESEQIRLNEPPPNFRLAQEDFARVLGITSQYLGSSEKALFPLRPPFSQTIPTIYQDLGIVPNFPIKHIPWAYEQQVQCDVPNQAHYLKCLKSVAKEKKNENLQTEVAIMESLEPNANKETLGLTEAYRLLKIDPEHAKYLKDEHILSTYSTIQEQTSGNDRERLTEALSVIGRHRNSELLSQAATQAGHVPMTYDQALSFLGAQATTEDEYITSLEAAKVAENAAAEEEAREAVGIIAEYRNSEYLRSQLAGSAPSQQMDVNRAHRLLGVDVGGAFDGQHLITQYEMNSKDQPGRAQELREALEVVARSTKSDELHGYIQALPNFVLHSASNLPLDEPRGLNNIGNTCYLASLLQYLFTIQPVRDLVQNMNEYAQRLEPGLDPAKRVDDASVSKQQIRRAQEFSKELHKLFLTLASTRASVVTPEIHLARLTLDSAVDNQVRRRSTMLSEMRPSLADEKDATTVPPAPASDVDSAVDVTESPKAADDDVVMEDADGVLPSATETSDDTQNNHESDKSMKPTTNGSQPPPVPPRPHGNASPQATGSEEKQQVERWAQQQDVREVMANVLVQLRWAIRGDLTGEKGEQIDRISRLFYGADKVVTVKPDSEERETNPFLEVIAYLSTACDIYSLIDGAFDASLIDAANGISQYREITQLPPILHVSVERGQLNRTKCEEPLQLPEHIHMDRYMATPEMLEKRRQAWAWKDELRTLQSRRNALTKTAVGLDIPQILSSTSDYLEHISQNAATYDLDTELVDARLLETLGSSADVARREIDELSIDIARYEQKLSNLFAENTSLPYRLHAIFMHRSGQARIDGGHWFIYIYDNKSSQWRRYNDETITKITDTKAFLNPMKERAREEGTSSFVVYVREDLAEQLVETVHRRPEAVESEGNGWPRQDV